MAVSEKTLQNYIKKINFCNDPRLPGMIGINVLSLIEHYKIPAIKWGYGGTLIGIETKKQIMVWRDKGSHLEFLGLHNKAESSTN